MDHVRYFATLLRLTHKAAFASPTAALAHAVLMFANNIIFFVFWLLFFARFRDLGGWTLADVATLNGVMCWVFGLMLAGASGSFELGRVIADGRLDTYLARPRHPLPALLLGQSTVSGFGDMASALVFWLWLGERTLGDLPYLIGISTAAAAIAVATMTLFQCAAFWQPRLAALTEDFFVLLIMLGMYPQHVFGAWGRLLVFTVLPLGFIALLPVEALREGDPLKALSVLGAALGYGILAVMVFDRGLRRYGSGNQMIENR